MHNLIIIPTLNSHWCCEIYNLNQLVLQAYKINGAMIMYNLSYMLSWGTSINFQIRNKFVICLI